MGRETLKLNSKRHTAAKCTFNKKSNGKLVPVFAGGDCTPELRWGDRIGTTNPQQWREIWTASGSPVLSLDSIVLDLDLRCRVLLAGAHGKT